MKTLSAELQHVSGIKGLALYFVFRAFIGRQLAFFVSRSAKLELPSESLSLITFSLYIIIIIIIIMKITIITYKRLGVGVYNVHLLSTPHTSRFTNVFEHIERSVLYASFSVVMQRLLIPMLIVKRKYYIVVSRM
jgi:hypothetical protein